MRKWILLMLLGSILPCIIAQTYGGGFMYHFYDASVPPQYHRSYEIDIEDTVVKFIVDSYGDVLLEETFSISRKQLEDFKISLKKLKVKKQKPDVDRAGCTGGTSEAFFFYYNDEQKYDYNIAQCGGKYYGNMKADLDAVRSLFRNIIPDFTRKMESTRMD